MVSIIAMGNTLQSFRDHTFLYEKLYTGKPNLGKKSNLLGIIAHACNLSTQEARARRFRVQSQTGQLGELLCPKIN